MESNKIESYPTALQNVIQYYYSSGFWYGFVTGLATGVIVTAKLVRYKNRN